MDVLLLWQACTTLSVWKTKTLAVKLNRDFIEKAEQIKPVGNATS